MADRFRFELLAHDPTSSARVGRLHTAHGKVPTPAFMPVGTQGAVKGLTVDQIHSTGTRMLLGNTYHLALRPGEQLIQRLGGLHAFMGWSGPILTDSGGFQVFSLAEKTKITEQGALFQSHIDGSRVLLTPERVVEIQQALGSDIAMVLDHVVALPCPADQLRDATERSLRWAARCRKHHQHPYQVLFGIVQGGLDDSLRARSVDGLVEIGFDGYAVGGLSVGEPPEQMYRVLQAVTPRLPDQQPRYLMGVGTPRDLLEGIARGIDMFDCVMPTRNGRNALAFTDYGPLRLRNRQYWDDNRPLMERCRCLACRHSRAYIRHLFSAREMLGPILLTHHNLMYYQDLMHAARAAIRAGQFEQFRQQRLAGWQHGDNPTGDSSDS